MKIKVKFIKTHTVLNVRQVGGLEGVTNNFINSLHLTQAIDRAALRGRRIFKIGSEMEFGED